MPEQYTILIIGTLIMGLLCGFIFLFMLLYKRSQLRIELERLHSNEELLKVEIETQRHTLQEVGMDLHDELGQLAALFHNQLGQFSGLSATNQRAHLNLSHTCEELNHQIRELTSSLKHHELEKLGLHALLQRDLSRLEKHQRYIVVYQNQAPEHILSSRTQKFVYRIIQECLNNIQKHSNASTITVLINQSPSNYTIAIKDDGIGFNPEVTNFGHGLNNLHERAKSIGADLSISSLKYKGTSILLTLKR